MLLTLPVKSAQIHTSPDKPAAAFLYMPALLPDCLRNPPRHIPSFQDHPEFPVLLFSPAFQYPA